MTENRFEPALAPEDHRRPISTRVGRGLFVGDDMKKTANTYSEKLRDPRWQKKRLEIMERDCWECCICSSSDKTLSVHHGYYEKGLEPWEYDSKSLWTLCNECHKRTQEGVRRIAKAASFVHPSIVAQMHFPANPDHFTSAQTRFHNHFVHSLLESMVSDGLLPIKKRAK